MIHAGTLCMPRAVVAYRPLPALPERHHAARGGIPRGKSFPGLQGLHLAGVPPRGGSMSLQSLWKAPIVRLLSFVVWAAVPGIIASGQNSPSVGVFMDFDSVPGAGLVEIMKNEVNELFKTSGISLNWRMTRENHGDQVFSRLVVFKFKGTCRTP